MIPGPARLGALVVVISQAAAGQTVPPAPAPAPPPGQRAPAANPPPALRLVSPRIDFGSHKPLSFLSETMTLINDGKEPVTLVRAMGECSCTDATILGKDKVLDPGEEVEILVAVEFPREMGMYTKQVLIYADGNATPFAVPFHFEVGYPISINGGPRYAIIIDRSGVVALKSKEDRPFRVRAVNGASPVFQNFDPSKDAPRDNYTIIYNWGELSPAALPRWMVIETDHPGAEMMLVPARVPGWIPVLEKTKWHSIDEHIALPAMPPNKPTRVTMLFTGKGLLPGQSIMATSSNPDLIVTVVDVRRPDRGGGIAVDLEFAPRPLIKGFISSVITVEYDGAKTGFDFFARIDSKAADAGR